MKTGSMLEYMSMNAVAKKFDEVIYDYPKPRSKALELEKKIKRDRPKYNKHHMN